MITARIQMISLANELWHQSPLAELLQDAFVSERRIGKGSNVDTERARYSLTCQFLEEAALDLVSKEQLTDSQILDIDYTETLRRIKYQAQKNSTLQALINSGRLMATVFPPTALKMHFEAWNAVGIIENQYLTPSVLKRMDLTRQLVDANAGLIDVISPFQGSIEMEELLHHTSDDPQQVGTIAQSLVNVANETEIHTQADWLRREIFRALNENDYVNFTNPNHVVITQVLNEFVYQAERTSAAIRVVYGDGSESEPFPLYGLGAPGASNTEAMQRANKLRVSLVSIRHPDQDLIVDLAWFLNQRVSSSRAFAETEFFCYEKTLQALEQIKKPIFIHLYQTGLQPAIMGFFRGFLTHRLKKPDETDVWVQPMFYSRNGGYRPGKIWW